LLLLFNCLFWCLLLLLHVNGCWVANSRSDPTFVLALLLNFTSTATPGKAWPVFCLPADVAFGLENFFHSCHFSEEFNTTSATFDPTFSFTYQTNEVIGDPQTIRFEFSSVTPRLVGMRSIEGSAAMPEAVSYRRPTANETWCLRNTAACPVTGTGTTSMVRATTTTSAKLTMPTEAPTSTQTTQTTQATPIAPVTFVTSDATTVSSNAEIEATAPFRDVATGKLGAIIGGSVVAVIVLLAIVFGALAFFLRHRRSQRTAAEDREPQQSSQSGVYASSSFSLSGTATKHYADNIGAQTQKESTYASLSPSEATG
jgi:hypothetical protein